MCQACQRHTSHFMCLCAKYYNKYFKHKGKFGTYIYMHSVEGEKHVLTMERFKHMKHRPILIWRKYSTI